jgi:hypothetical protein
MKSLSFCLLCSLFLCNSSVVKAQSGEYSWTTIAGSAGVIGSADGTNEQARFKSPAGIAVDGAGTLFVADFLNYTIRKIVPVGTNWVVSTLVGQALAAGSVDGTNTDARLNRPASLAVDSSGNLFWPDLFNHTVREAVPVGTNWVVKTLAGMPPVSGSADGTNSDARFFSPSGITLGSNGVLYVVDRNNFTVRQVTPSGTNWVVTTIAGTALVYGFIDGTNGDAEFDFPYCIARNTDGSLYVTDFGYSAIRQVSQVGADWVVSTIANKAGTNGSADGLAGEATFNSPIGIAADKAGVLYVADQSNNTIRKIVPGATGWVVSTVGGKALQPGAANGTNDVARFTKPWGVAVDKAGNLFVTDSLNHTIRKGTLLSGAVPALQVFRSSDQVVISWPTSASNFVLETSATLSPGVLWSPLTNGFVMSGGNFFFTNNPAGPPAFFRLRKQ